MTDLTIRKLLKRLGMLKFARSIKRRFNYTEMGFMPCTPHLLIAVNNGLRHCIKEGIAEGSDYLEFGIFRGFTLWYAQALANDLGIKDMRFFGFDSFFGLPAVKKIDSGDKFREGAYSCSRQDVERFLSEYEVDWKRTFLIEGWFNDTLTKETITRHQLRKCALCVVDCDLYESAKLALDFAGHLMRDKSVILFDDWTHFANEPTKGEQKAFNEFLAKNSHLYTENFTEFGGHGKGFILRYK